MSTEKAPLTLLDPHASDEPFPPVELALNEPNGLIAFGGDLSPTRLITAYKSGIFPWYNPDEPIYWWSPNPRAVLYPNKIIIRRSLRKSIRNKGYTITFDHDFSGVIQSCATVRSESGGTWISNDMFMAYTHLYNLGHAHSVEVWNDKDELVGGLYGVSTGGVFSGESMFSKERDASKVAFVALAWHLQQWGYSLIDCQIKNSHLSSLGAENIDRKKYLSILKTTQYFKHNKWEFDASCDLSHWQPT